tara:strand:+ start:1663 stop:2661 length:999 start_codon:yes stop_codon:yes gene_type:complete
MSDAENLPTSVTGAAQTIKGLLNQSADNQPALTETATVTEKTLTQASEPLAPSNVPEENNALSEEYDESVDSDIIETTELSEEPIFPVVIDGQKYEVNQNELINGYQRQADYSRKTEELSIERKQQEDQIQREKETVQTQMANLHSLEQSLKMQLDSELQNIDFDKMYEEDPVQASRLQYQMQKRQKDLEAARMQIQHQSSVQYDKYVANEEKQMFIKMPEMKDVAKATEVKVNMKTYLSDQGYGSQEIANLTDHRMLLILKDAMAYRQLQKSKPGLVKRVSDAPRVLRSGTAKTKGERRELANSENKKRLAKSGRWQDAVSVFRAGINTKS